MIITDKKIFFIISILTFLLISNNVLLAQNIDPNLQSLNGINQIGIIVEKFNKPLHDSGIKEEEIKKVVEKELNLANIKFVSNAKIKEVHGSPYLYINIGAIKSMQQNLYAVSLSVQLRQDVLLSRDLKQKYYGAATWSTSNIGIFSKDKLNEINDFTKILVDKFIKDLLVANGRG